MPKNQKEWKTCHACGLEAIDPCEMGKGHFPFDETRPPCSYCIRSLEKDKQGSTWRADFYDEQWVLESNKTPTIQDADPHERRLLQTLHRIVSDEFDHSKVRGGGF